MCCCLDRDGEGNYCDPNFCCVHGATSHYPNRPYNMPIGLGLLPATPVGSHCLPYLQLLLFLGTFVFRDLPGAPCLPCPALGPLPPTLPCPNLLPDMPALLTFPHPPITAIFPPACHPTQSGTNLPTTCHHQDVLPAKHLLHTGTPQLGRRVYAHALCIALLDMPACSLLPLPTLDCHCVLCSLPSQLLPWHACHLTLPPPPLPIALLRTITAHAQQLPTAGGQMDPWLDTGTPPLLPHPVPSPCLPGTYACPICPTPLTAYAPHCCPPAPGGRWTGPAGTTTPAPLRDRGWLTFHY